jgi:hypothetical protein
MECSPDVPGIPPGFPVSVRAAKALIAGHPADLLVSAYTDATVLFVNQLGSAGTVLQARCVTRTTFACGMHAPCL